MCSPRDLERRDDVFVLLFMLLLDASQRPTAHHSSAFLSSASTSLNIALLVQGVLGQGEEVDDALLWELTDE